MTFDYTILHNLTAGHFFDGYKEGDRLVRGWTSTVEFEGVGTDALGQDALKAAALENQLEAAEQVFAKHNQDDRPDGARSDGKSAPSLSVGDVVVLTNELHHTVVYACEPVGFKEVPVPGNVETTKSWLEAWEDVAEGRVSPRENT